MITADQILIHAIGDYILQSDWMANEKTKRWFPAACHALVYQDPRKAPAFRHGDIRGFGQRPTAFVVLSCDMLYNLLSGLQEQQ
jgi:hypothetical protein